MFFAATLAHCAALGALCPDAQRLAVPDAGEKCVSLVSRLGLKAFAGCRGKARYVYAPDVKLNVKLFA